jgi:hypothetical protein
MNRRRAALLSLLLALSACAEGGTRGSGISTTVQGNVVMVQTATLSPPRPLRSSALLAGLQELFALEHAAGAGSAIQGISVDVEGWSGKDQTDAMGRFALHGPFDGFVTVVFQVPDDGGSARITVNVPAGGMLTLNNVRLDTQDGTASADTQAVDFEGIITETDCRALTVAMVSSQSSTTDSDHYTLRLDTSVVHDSQGNTLSCEDLRAGERATVQGAVNPDGTFGDATVEIQN